MGVFSIEVHTGTKTSFLSGNYKEFDVWNINFVKNKALEMWILWKIRLSKREFLDRLRIFALVCTRNEVCGRIKRTDWFYNLKSNSPRVEETERQINWFNQAPLPLSSLLCVRMIRESKFFLWSPNLYSDVANLVKSSRLFVFPNSTDFYLSKLLGLCNFFFIFMIRSFLAFRGLYD